MSNTQTANTDPTSPEDPADGRAPETEDAAPETVIDDDLSDAVADAAAALDGDTAEASAVAEDPPGPPPTPSAETLAETGPSVEVLAAEVSELKDKLLRAMAETENIRRRAERDRAETAKYAVSNFARDMLSVADNVRRALETIKPEDRQGSEPLENLAVGLEMVERETLTTLERHGVKAINAQGQRFDSNLHEAMFEYEDPSQPERSVGQVIETGYTLHDRLLRPAKVGVTKGGPKPDAAKPAPAPAETPGDAAAKDAKDAYDGPKGEAGGTVDESL